RVIEEYDKVSSLLAVDQARAVVVAGMVKTLDTRLARARAVLLPVVHRVYEVGELTALRVLLDAGSTVALVHQWGMAEAFAHRQRDQIAAFGVARGRAVAA